MARESFSLSSPHENRVSMSYTEVHILGSANYLPGPGRDTASFVINGVLQVDCGWYSAVRLQECGLDVLELRTLFFTHLHQDHYTGLAGLLYARSMRGHREGQPPSLRIVGPAVDLGRVVELTRSFLQADRFPEVWQEIDLQPIEPGTPYKDEAFEIHTFPSQHAIVGMCGRFTDRHTGVVIGVRQLRLIHLREAHRDESLAAAQAIFPATQLAEEGERITLP
jgi:ribonuclease BN (tRNA processing enzyme)